MAFANSAPPVALFATTNTVSSPAMVPIAVFNFPFKLFLSIALANNCAPPGGVRTTAKFPLADTDMIKFCAEVPLLASI